jgi:4-amino-4-deoxy-L-arabinose transferase-like glycosyltransferase
MTCSLDGSHAPTDLDDDGPRWRQWGIRLAIVTAFFAAVAPTLRWLDFFHAEENVVIATALEMKRTGNWLVPTLQGKPRTIKPPLTVWITALAIRDATVRGLDNPDPAVRHAARRDLAFESRWPTVVCAGLMLVAVYELGRAIGGTRFALLCVCACGTCWYFLVRQGPKNTVDLQLALWVSWANACLAWAVLRGRVWGGMIGAGVALGLATMSKGPAVPLLQSVVPVVLFLLWAKKITGRAAAARMSVPVVITAILMMLAVGLWWYVLVLLRQPEIKAVWFAELTRKGANDLPPDEWYHYLRALRFMFPWLGWLVIGIAAGAATLWNRRHDRRLLAFLLAVVPLLVMNLFEERKERYLIPLIGPLAVVAAWPVLEHLKNAPRWEAWEKIGALLHWGGLVVLAVVLPIAGVLGLEKMRTVAGQPWFSWPVAGAGLAAMGVVIAAGMAAYRRRRIAMVTATVLVMAVAQALYVWGYSRDDAGVSDMGAIADTILAAAPDARLYSSYSGEKPGIVFMPGVDLSIYTNRTVPYASEPAKLSADDRPVVVLAVARKGEAEPAAPGPAWNELARADRSNKEKWRVYVLPVAR